MNPEDTAKLQDQIQYHFKDQVLLSTALTHRSSLNEQGIKQSNERLEFLGDAVLELIITNYLFHERPADPEGVLTAARSAIVKTESLANVAKSINLGNYLHMSKGEVMSGGRENNATLENTVEALIGAIFKDGGLPAAAAFVDQHIIPHAKEILAKNQLKDPKSMLQERVQGPGLVSPNYQVVTQTGPDHDKTFEVSVSVNNKELGRGKGKSKQEAEQQAAQQAINSYPPAGK